MPSLPGLSVFSQQRSPLEAQKQIYYILATRDRRTRVSGAFRLFFGTNILKLETFNGRHSVVAMPQLALAKSEDAAPDANIADGKENRNQQGEKAGKPAKDCHTEERRFPTAACAASAGHLFDSLKPSWQACKTCSQKARQRSSAPNLSSPPSRVASQKRRAVCRESFR